MSTLTLSPRTLSPRLFESAGSRFEPTGGPTLDDLIASGWKQITSGEAAACPVCHGELRPVWAAGSRPVGGRCQDCGTRLS